MADKVLTQEDLDELNVHTLVIRYAKALAMVNYFESRENYVASMKWSIVSSNLKCRIEVVLRRLTAKRHHYTGITSGLYQSRIDHINVLLQAAENFELTDEQGYEVWMDKYELYG